MRTIEKGREITDQTAEAFDVAVENIDHANQQVEKITDMVKDNVRTVTNAAGKIGRISDVVERNVEVSHNTKQASSDMADITEKLLKMVE